MASRVRQMFGALRPPAAKAPNMAGELRRNSTAVSAGAAQGLRRATTLLAGGALVGEVEGIVHRQHKARGAFCGIHIAQAAQFLSRAGVQIALAVRQCLPKDSVPVARIQRPEDFMRSLMSPCTASVEGIVGSLSWAAGYISMVASECAAHANIDALCSGQIAALIGETAQAAMAGDVIRETCAVPPHDLPPGHVWPIRRRLEAAPRNGTEEDPGTAPGTAAPARRADVVSMSDYNPAFTPELAAIDAKSGMDAGDRDLETSMCVIDATQVATAIGMFSLSLDQIIFSCAVKDMAGGVPQVGPVAQDLCIADVSYVLFSVFSAISFLSATVSHCASAIGLRRGTECGAAVNRILASFAGIPLVAAGIDLTCPGTESNLAQRLGPMAVPVATLSAIGRRLGAQRTEEEAEEAEEGEEEGLLARGLGVMGFLPPPRRPSPPEEGGGGGPAAEPMPPASEVLV